MPNNYLNHNVPGYSGDYDPGLSNRDSAHTSNRDLANTSNGDLTDTSNRNLADTSNNEDPELTISNPEVPFVSRYGMVNARNSLEDVEMYRATLFKLKTEPEKDRVSQRQDSDGVFLRRSRDPDEINPWAVMNTPVAKLQPVKTINKIKVEPIDKVEGNLSLEMETKPSEYPPESYSELVENSSHIDTTNPRADELDDGEDDDGEDDEQDNIDYHGYTCLRTYNSERYDGPRENELQEALFFSRRLSERANVNDLNLSCVKVQRGRTSTIVKDNPSAYQLKRFSELLKNSSQIDTTNLIAEDELENGLLYLEQHNIDSDEESDVPSLTVYFQNRDVQPTKFVSEYNLTTNTGYYELEHIRSFFQKPREEPKEIDEMYSPLVGLHREVTPPPINTLPNLRASYLDNGNTNIIENPAVISKKIRKKKEDASAPTRISRRIKKPRLMYNV